MSLEFNLVSSKRGFEGSENIKFAKHKHARVIEWWAMNEDRHFKLGEKAKSADDSPVIQIVFHSFAVNKINVFITW